MSNNFGKDSELHIRTKTVKGDTILKETYFTAPYKVAKPFYDYELKLTKVMVMSASAGIMEGDSYHMKIELDKGSKLALLGQSYSKIHKMKDGFANQHNEFNLEENAFFDYVQKPVIPFADSNFNSSLICHMKEGSVFLYSEIIACGREKRGERFEFKNLKNCNKVYFNEELIFIDNQVLMPAQQQLFGIGFFEGYTHQGTLAYFSQAANNEIIEKIYSRLEETDTIEFGVTRTSKYGIVVRILENSSDYIEKKFNMLRELIYLMEQSQ